MMVPTQLTVFFILLFLRVWGTQQVIIKHTFCIQQVFAKLDGGLAARRFLDHFSHVTDAVSNLGTPSSQAETNWITDRVAPD